MQQVGLDPQSSFSPEKEGICRAGLELLDPEEAITERAAIDQTTALQPPVPENCPARESDETIALHWLENVEQCYLKPLCFICSEAQ